MLSVLKAGQGRTMCQSDTVALHQSMAGTAMQAAVHPSPRQSVPHGLA